MKTNLKFSMALAVFLFGVGGANFANAEVRIENVTDKSDLTSKPYYAGNGNTINILETSENIGFVYKNGTLIRGASPTEDGIQNNINITGVNGNNFVGYIYGDAGKNGDGKVNTVNNKVVIDSSIVDLSDTNLQHKYDGTGQRAIIGGYSSTAYDSYNNSVIIQNQSEIKSKFYGTTTDEVNKGKLHIYGGIGGKNKVSQNQITIKDSTLTNISDDQLQTNFSYIIGGYNNYGTAAVYENKVAITNSILNRYKVGGAVTAGSNDGSKAYNNDVIFENSTTNDEIYGARSLKANVEASNNHVSVKNGSKFGSIWGGQAYDTTDSDTNLNHSNYNTVVIENSENSTTITSNGNGDPTIYLRAASTRGGGDDNYNTLYLKNVTLKKPTHPASNVVGKINILGASTQNAARGETKYNQLILDEVKDSDKVASDLKAGYSYGNGLVEKNRIYINNSEFANSIAIGGQGKGDTLGNIAYISGNSVVKGIYGGYSTETGKVNDNLVVLADGKVTQNVYGAFSNSGETANNAVYFINGVVGGVVGGGNLANTGNKLILGDSSSNFGERKAGSIENFESLQFNALKAATDTEKNAVLELTDSQTGANLSGVAINFLDPSTSDNSVKVTVGGNGGVGVEAVRDSDGGGKNAISNLTKNAKKYSPNLNEIAIVASGIATNNDIKETLQRTLNDGRTQDQTTYGIGDTFNYTYEKINLEEAGKYYLINSLSDIENYQDIDIDDKLNNGKTLKDTSVETITAIQPNQIYKIIDKDTYTRNLRGMFAENKKAIYITGINEVEETWENDKFDSDEFTKFGKPDNKDNHIFIEANAGDLGGKTIYGGYSDSEDVNNNNIYLNQNANLSNATIIGGYSKSGKVSGNNIDLNNTDIKADIILASTDSGSVEVSNDNIKNADGVRIDGSVTIAKSTGSANLNGLNFEMPKFKEITDKFILADTSAGTGTANENTLILGNDIKVGEIYVAKGADEANANILEINGGVIDSSKVVVGSAKSANDNIANFNSGEITGTLYGGSGDTSENNTLNVNDTKLKAGNVADFQILNFKKDYLSSTTSEENSALILTSNSENLDFSGVEVQIGGEKYNPSTDYGLGENQKFYLVSSQSDEKNSDKLVNFTDSKIAGKGESITHWDGSEGTVIDALQTNTEYVIDNADTFERTLRGMFVAKNTKALYLTGDSKMTEKIGDTIGGDDFFTKFGGDKGGNTIKLVPGDDGLDLSDITLDGGSEDNKLQIGDDKNKVETGKLKVKDVTSFTDIEMNVGKVTDDSVIVELTDGTNTDLSGSNVTLNIDNVSELDKGPVHVFKTSSGNDIAKNADSMTVNIGTTTTLTFEQEASGDHFNLVIPEEEDDTPTDDTPTDKPTPTPITTTNPQTKIFNEARIAGLAAVWEGSYLISNHLDRIIPDAFSELFPYAIVEGYDKRYNTGSHVDALGFNANAGLASKGANSSGEFTMGAFVEYGISKYDAYLDDGTTGDGKNYYMGGGFFGKQENNSGSYFEGTFRIGQLVTDFDGDVDKKHYDFDVKSTYIAAHAGLGKVFALTQSNDLDIYARYFYTHIESAEVKLNDGTDLKFDSAQSNKIRVGLKDDFKLDDNNKLYVGAAYEYEFDAKAGARLFVPGYNTQGELLSPSLKGSTGIGEIGYEYKNDKIKFDAGVKGYVGKQEGVSAQMAISIAF